MEIKPFGSDRLGLQNCRRDSNVPPLKNIINRDIIIKLKDLLQSYDDAFIAFNQIMAMETFLFIKDTKQLNLRTEFTLGEIYKTRMLRADFDSKSHTDPFQRQIHKWLRTFHFKRQTKNAIGEAELSQPRPSKSSTYS
ncbi:hypothetical protein PoMZ_09003 [Pyricularia oryzae]|uniref:Uncharacterized protein n=1 Tax=Pyricularia oryzae TaxID=318829 RepID=A0A4P7MYI8_PYROR|nr:hypothetical protein PoMZ_09003 [Pyricularia oryzae]